MDKKEAFYKAITDGAIIRHSSFKKNNNVRIEARIICAGDDAVQFGMKKDCDIWDDGWEIVGYIKN